MTRANVPPSLVHAALVLVLSLPACAPGPSEGERPDGDLGDVESGLGATVEVDDFGTNPGSLRMHTYVPKDLPSGAPLVVALHGCGTAAKDYERVGWNQLADLRKFAVLYPETRSLTSNRCFRWFGVSAISRQGDEPTSIVQMVEWMKRRYALDASRVFVTGLSAGGAMTAVLTATYPDVFSAGAVMAGVPYACAIALPASLTCMLTGRDLPASVWGSRVREAREGVVAPKPRMSIWHGSLDLIVRPKNLRELAKQWTDVHGIDTRTGTESSIGDATHTEYRDSSGAVAVETWEIFGMGHAVAVDPGFSPSFACGAAGPFISDVDLCSTYYAAKFFGLEQ